MIITMDEIVRSTVDGFAGKYPHFAPFTQTEETAPYWRLVLQTLQDRDLVGHIVFCNDIFGIPPVKTFLLVHEGPLTDITGRADARLPDAVKKSLGAVWGYVFKEVFAYAGQKSVSVTLPGRFMIKRATCYTDPQKKLVLAY